jgi:hypothetical protein
MFIQLFYCNCQLVHIGGIAGRILGGVIHHVTAVFLRCVWHISRQTR